MPNVIIPKKFSTRKKLIAIPETEYRRFLMFSNATEVELAEVREAEADIATGRVIQANSAQEALKEARARGWVN